MFNIVVAQSGGPTAAINASLAGVVNAAINCDEIGTVFGSKNGIEGVLGENFVKLDNIFANKENLFLLKNTPSSALGSCRYKLKDSLSDSSDYAKIAEVFKKNNVGAFFYIGGNDSMDTVMKLDAYFKSINLDVKVIGVPKTIDNDLCETDHTPGFGSAAKYVACTLKEIIADSRVYDLPAVTIVEIMGRSAGWLTASSCLLRANGEVAPHLIYLPEAEFSIDNFISDVRKMLELHKTVIIAVSEGIDAADDRYSNFGSATSAADAFGHKYLSGVGKYLEHVVSDVIGCKVRSIELNVMQRCSSHITSLTDTNEAFEIGEAAVTEAISNESGKMMCFIRESSSPYAIKIGSVDVTAVANKEKLFPKEWINLDGNNVNEKALEYFLPLIQGENQIAYLNGLPVHFDLKELL